MAIGLFSIRNRCSSTFAAMKQFPEDFGGVRCLVVCQPVTRANHHRALTEVRPIHRFRALAANFSTLRQ